jgi:hypothetical protein
VRRWYELMSARPAVQRGVALLEERMKIGNPDAAAREALFGRSQRTQGGLQSGHETGSDRPQRARRRRTSG